MRRARLLLVALALFEVSTGAGLATCRADVGRAGEPRERVIAVTGVTSDPQPRGCPTLPPHDAVVRGERLFEPCATCHSTTGGPGAGPTVAGLLGRRIPLSDGSDIVADRAYVYESIRRPDAKVVRGYPTHLMPTFSLSDREIDALTDYIATLPLDLPFAPERAFGPY